MIDSILSMPTNKKARLLYYAPILLSLYSKYIHISPLIPIVFLGILVGILQGFLEFNGMEMNGTKNVDVKEIGAIPYFFATIMFIDVVLCIIFGVLSFINPSPLIGLIKLEPYYLGIFIPSVFLSIFCEVVVVGVLLMKTEKINIHLKE